MKIQTSIASLLKKELRGILVGEYYDEIEKEIEKLTIKTDVMKSQEFHIKLSCKNFERQSLEFNYEILIDPTGPTKIIQMSAQNQRYKTTALLIISILLGYYVKNNEDLMVTSLSFDDKREILNNDRLLQRIENLKNVMFNLEDEDKNLYDNKEIILEIKTVDETMLYLRIDNKVINISSFGNNRIIEITGEQTYNKYLGYISELNLFTPHLISKGRNFVKYILVEETKNYWYSLKAVIERLKNKQVKWLELSSTLPVTVIKKRIDALNFLIKAKERFSDYFEHRDLFLEYLSIKKTYTYNPNLSIENLEHLKLEYQAYTGQRQDIEDYINEHFNEINTKLTFTFFGTYKEQLEQIDLLWGRMNISSSIGLNMSDMEEESVLRPFNISYEEERISKVLKVTDITTLRSGINRIENLQNGYYEASNYYNKHKDNLKENVNRLNELQLIIKKTRNDLDEISRGLEAKKKFDQLLEKVQPVLEVLEKINEHQRNQIEKYISEAAVQNLRQLNDQVSRYTKMLDNDIFNNEELSVFLNNLRNAYEIFGTEVSAMSKGDITSSTLKYTNKNILLDQLIVLFEQDIIKRCPYYFKATSKGVVDFKVNNYSFWDRVFYSEDSDVLDLQSGLSGGTDSVMTVYSIASSSNGTRFGNVLLIDEWGDVSVSFHDKVKEKLKELNTFAFAIFVDVDDQYDKIKTFIEGENS